jgi:hypothetical protein
LGGENPSEVLEIRNLDTRWHVARKLKRPDEWDPPIAPYDPYKAQRALSDFDVITDDEEQRVTAPPATRGLVEGDA